MDHQLNYYFPWTRFEPELMPVFIREWLSHGVDRFVFTEGLLSKCLAEPEWIARLHTVERDFHVQFLSMHGVCNPGDELDVVGEDRRRKMLASHLRGLEIAAEFGSRTYTVHVGTGLVDAPSVSFSEKQQLAAETLTKLVPAAEKLGITLAVENCFHPGNSARDLLALIQPYIGNPAVGVCYDTGHANIMRMPPGKRIDRYRNYIHNCWHKTGIIPENDVLDLLYPHIVATHIHDNDGYGDLHAMPGDGTVNWQELLPKLRNCPRMMEMQTEVPLYTWGINWSGELPAPPGGYAVKDAVETFRKLGF